MRRAPASLIFVGAAVVLGCARRPTSVARRVDSLALAGWTPRDIRAGDNGARQAALDAIMRGARLAIVLHTRTYEGDPAPQYLLADGGRVRYLLDTRRDRNSEPRDRVLWETRVDSVTLGYATELPDGGREYVALPPEAARVSMRHLVVLGWAGGRVIVAL
jgi:hypothetical protein